MYRCAALLAIAVCTLAALCPLTCRAAGAALQEARTPDAPKDVSPSGAGRVASLEARVKELTRLLTEERRRGELQAFRTLQAEAWGPVNGHGAPELVRVLNLADAVFVADVERETPSETCALSDPPGWSTQVRFAPPGEVIRGTAPAAGTPLGFSVFRDEPPRFPIGTWMVVALARGEPGEAPSVAAAVLADPDVVRLARHVSSVPCGWLPGEPSPWASTTFGGDWRSPTGDPQHPESGAFCQESGRPLLWAGPGVRLEVAQVPPRQRVRFVNDYGDGRFRVTVTNTAGRAVTVPALVSDGRQVRWADSLVIVQSHDTAYGRRWGTPRVLPGAGGTAVRRPTVLEVGQGVSAEVDVLPLVDGSRGGGRLYFRFCLGELSAGHFFDYSKAHHGRMRDAANPAGRAAAAAAPGPRRAEDLMKRPRRTHGSLNK